MSARRWHLLIHQLPPKPAYLRAKVGHRLARCGAVALKNSVYVLPATDECLEDLQWIAAEAAAGGGTAYVATAEFSVGTSDAEIVEAFRAARTLEYEAVREEIRVARRGRKPLAKAVVESWRRRFDALRRIDFFAARAADDAEMALIEVERSLNPMGESKAKLKPLALKDLSGKTWVTRRGVFVDRIATFWLVRRFVDAKALVRFVDAGAPARKGEVRFDMVDAEFTHVGERCTFETLLSRLPLDDSALRAVAEVVHDIDLKDDAFERPETVGIETLLRGLVASCPEDGERMERGMSLFDDLYRAYSNPGTRRGADGGPKR